MRALLKPDFNPITLFEEIEKLFPEVDLFDAMESKICRKVIMREIQDQLRSMENT